MPKKGFIPNKLKPWIEARKKYHLTHAQIQMARELGMNPKKFGSLANHAGYFDNLTLWLMAITIINRLHMDCNSAALHCNQ